MEAPGIMYDAQVPLWEGTFQEGYMYQTLVNHSISADVVWSVF